MSFWEPGETLRAAAERIELVASGLDGSWTACECCDLKVFANKPEANLQRSLLGTARKLRAQAQQLQAGLQSEPEGTDDE